MSEGSSEIIHEDTTESIEPPFYIGENEVVNEFGMKDGQVILIDEVHTPDSSRYFYIEGYKERQENGEAQKQLSKEFVRQWLIENGFQGLEGQIMPVMPDDFVQVVTDRYIELYEVITGNKFHKSDTSNITERIQKNLDAYITAL